MRSQIHGYMYMCIKQNEWGQSFYLCGWCVGDWQIDYVTGGPFQVPISDSLDIRVYSMKDGTICNLPHLIGIVLNL